MSTRTYPYTAWALTPSFKPKQVTLTKLYHSWGAGGEWDESDSRKLYSATNDLFPTKEAAIAVLGARPRAGSQVGQDAREHRQEAHCTGEGFGGGCMNHARFFAPLLLTRAHYRQFTG
jgi:hypothetical protein